MVEEEREELGGVQESRAELCVCGWVEVGGLFRGNKPSSLERKMSRMPVENECKANLEQQYNHPPKIIETPYFLRTTGGDRTKLPANCPFEDAFFFLM